MNPLKKLDWNVTDETDLIWTSPALFGGPLTLGAYKLPSSPPPPCRRHHEEYHAKAAKWIVLSPDQISHTHPVASSKNRVWTSGVLDLNVKHIGMISR